MQVKMQLVVNNYENSFVIKGYGNLLKDVVYMVSRQTNLLKLFWILFHVITLSRVSAFLCF